MHRVQTQTATQEYIYTLNNSSLDKETVEQHRQKAEEIKNS